MSRVFVSAASVLSPIGNGLKDFTDALRGGASGVRDIRGELVDFNFPVAAGAPIHFPTRSSYYTTSQEVAALAEQLFQQLLLSFDLDLPIDLILCGCADIGSNWQDSLVASGEKPELAFDVISEETSNEFLAKLLKQQGFHLTPQCQTIGLNNTCTTGNALIGHAFRRLKSGKNKRILVVSIEQLIKPPVLLPYLLLGALNTDVEDVERSSCPFSLNRSGFVKGESATALVLEVSDQQCESYIGEILGFAQSSDGWHFLEGHPRHTGAISSMITAMKDAQLALDQVEYINAHGTSTQLNDLSETDAVKATFGRRAYEIPMSSIKSQVGHSNIACGVLEALATLIMMKESFVSPTLNLNVVDPKCDLDYVSNVSRTKEFRRSLSNSFGFGGQNATLILGRSE